MKKNYVKPEVTFVSLTVHDRIAACSGMGLIWGGEGNFSQQHFEEWGGCATWGELPMS